MKRSIGIMLLALVASMAFVGAAVADEAAGEPQATMVTPIVVVDEEAGTVTIALPVDGEDPECLADEGSGDAEPVDGDGDGDGDAEPVDDDGKFGPGDCVEIIIDHPSGKTHHGAVVSSVAKELHPSTLDGVKKGVIMRAVAHGGTVPVEGESGETGVTKASKPDKAPKAPKGDKSNRGKGHGKAGANPGKGG